MATETVESPDELEKALISAETTSENQSLELRILPLQRALEFASRISIRGENHLSTLKVFRRVQDATQDAMRAKFQGSDLPDCDELSRELDLPKEFVYECLLELSGIGKWNTKTLVLALPLLYLVGSKAPLLKCKMVYVRPSPREGTSLDIYLDEIEKRNIKAISEWTMLRKPLELDKQKELLEKLLGSSDTFSIIMQKSITKLFYEHKEQPKIPPRVLYHNFVRPMIKKLIHKGNLLYTKTVLKGDTLKGIYWNKEEELAILYEALLGAYDKHLGPGVQTLNSDEEAVKVIASIQKIALENLNSIQQKIIRELYLLCHVLPSEILKKTSSPKKGKETEEIKELRDRMIAILRQFPRAMEKSKITIASKDLERVEHLDEILHTKYALKTGVSSFYLHKEKNASALMIARGDFERYKDPTQNICFVYDGDTGIFG